MQFKINKISLFTLFLFLVTFSYPGLVRAADSITITTPVAYRVFQRNSSNQGNISITGTYTGTPTSIEASWNGNPYSTIVASPSGGTFSGTLSSQTAGQGTLTVRFTNATTTSASKDYIGIGDIFVIAGQSNASGKGFNLQTYSHPTLKAGLFGNDDNWKELADPVDSGLNQVDAVSDDGTNPIYPKGSIWPRLATLFMADQNVPVAFIPCSLTSSSLTAWQPNSLNHGDVTTLYGSMYRRITAVGSVKAVLLWQGETEAANGTSQSSYKALLDSFASAVNSDFGVKVSTAAIGDRTASGGVFSDIAPGNFDNIRLAEQQAWDDGLNILIGPELYDIDLVAGGGDGLHFRTDSVIQTAANRWWAALKQIFYGGTGGRGPRLTTLETNIARTQIIATFNSNSLPLLPSSGISGFTVYNNGAAVTISNVVRITPNQVAVNLSSPATGIITLSFGTGRTGTGVAVPTDSGTYNLPAEISVGSIVTTLSTPSSPICTTTPPGIKAPWLYEAKAKNNHSILLRFTGGGGPIDRYVLEFGTKSNIYLWGSINIGGGEITSYLVDALSPNTTYYFKIRGGNGCATGPWSNEISGTTSFLSSNNTFKERFLNVNNIPPQKSSSSLPTEILETKMEQAYSTNSIISFFQKLIHKIFRR